MLNHGLPILRIFFLLFISIQNSYGQQNCPANMIQLYNGVSCQTDQACQRLSPGFFCYNGFCCANSISVPSGYGSACTYDNQCAFANSQCVGNICYCRADFNYNGQNCQPTRGQLPNSGGTACIGGYCQPTGPRARDPKAATCRNPSAHAEVYGSTPKNCISQSCSPGYHCEYNSAILQYICCGGSNGQYGEIKMYPGYSNLPLQCTGINSCTFVDFPYCVFSQSYNHNVCCSKQECL